MQTKVFLNPSYLLRIFELNKQLFSYYEFVNVIKNVQNV